MFFVKNSCFSGNSCDAKQGQDVPDSRCVVLPRAFGLLCQEYLWFSVKSISVVLSRVFILFCPVVVFCRAGVG